jgi:hypothetical protein
MHFTLMTSFCHKCSVGKKRWDARTVMSEFDGCSAEKLLTSTSFWNGKNRENTLSYVIGLSLGSTVAVRGQFLMARVG